jgi:putative heme degradation protein
MKNTFKALGSKWCDKVFSALFKGGVSSLNFNNVLILFGRIGLRSHWKIQTKTLDFSFFEKSLIRKKYIMEKKTKMLIALTWNWKMANYNVENVVENNQNHRHFIFIIVKRENCI